VTAHRLPPSPVISTTATAPANSGGRTEDDLEIPAFSGSEGAMSDKQQVIALHRLHPDWCADQIAAKLGCHAGYVRATAARNSLILPKKQRGVDADATIAAPIKKKEKRAASVVRQNVPQQALANPHGARPPGADHASAPFVPRNAASLGARCRCLKSTTITFAAGARVSSARTSRAPSSLTISAATSPIFLMLNPPRPAHPNSMKLGFQNA